MTYPKLPTLIEPDVLVVRTAIHGDVVAAAALQRVLDYYEALRFLDVSRHVEIEDRLQATLTKALQQQTVLLATNNDYVLQMARRLEDLSAVLRARFEAVEAALRWQGSSADTHFRDMVIAYEHAQSEYRAGWQQMLHSLGRAATPLAQQPQPKLAAPPPKRRPRRRRQARKRGA